MKHLILAAAAASIALAGQAGAADISKPETLFGGPKMTAAGATVTWTRAYIGGQFGYGNANHSLRGVQETHENVTCSNGGTLGTDGTCAPKDVTEKEVGDTCPAGGVTAADGLSCSYPSALTYSTTAVDNTAVGALLDGVNSHGWLGGVNIGGDMQAGRFVFGIFGDYNWASLKTKAALSGTGIDAGYAIEAKKNDEWTLGARAGYLLSDNVLGYGIVGFTQTDYTFPDEGKKSFDKTFDGITAGGGVEWQMRQGISLFSEYRHTWYGKKTLASWTDIEVGDGYADVTKGKITDTIDEDKVLMGLRISTSVLSGK